MLLTSKENSTVHMRNVKTKQTKVQDRNAINANYLLLLTNGRTGGRGPSGCVPSVCG